MEKLGNSSKFDNETYEVTIWKFYKFEEFSRLHASSNDAEDWSGLELTTLEKDNKRIPLEPLFPIHWKRRGQ